MKQLQRGDKIYLDPEQNEESAVNQFLDCRDGIVEVMEFRRDEGYGSKCRLFLCRDVKHESIAIIRQTEVSMSGPEKWVEQVMFFEDYTFEFLERLIKGEKGYGYSLVRDY